MKPYNISQPNEVCQKLDIMIDEALPTSFNQQLWNIISFKDPVLFLDTQKDIMRVLLSDMRLFESFFQRFYHNHTQLYNWYMLANENQQEIKKYVFKHLLQKSCRQYREQLRDVEIKQKMDKTNEIFRNQQPKSKPKKVNGFSKMHLNRNQQNQQKVKIINENTQQSSKQDYHELFLKTFNACDGFKYIFYDFGRHMRGIEQKKYYNNFIRFKRENKSNISTPFQQYQNSTSLSIHNQKTDYFHQKQENFDHNYSNYNLNSIGSVNHNVHSHSTSIFKKMPNIFKVTRPGSKNFLMKKRKIQSSNLLIK